MGILRLSENLADFKWASFVGQICNAAVRIRLAGRREILVRPSERNSLRKNTCGSKVDDSSFFQADTNSSTLLTVPRNKSRSIPYRARPPFLDVLKWRFCRKIDARISPASSLSREFFKSTITLINIDKLGLQIL